MSRRSTARRTGAAAGMALTAALAMSLTTATPSYAGTDSADLSVTASVVNAVSGSITTSGVAFGPYSNPNGGVVNATGAVVVTVTAGAPYTVDLGGGLTPAGTVRQMLPNGQTTSPLKYNLFVDPMRTQVWGTAVNGGMVSGTGNGSAQPINVYGQIMAQQTLTIAGAYSDTVVATVQF